MKNFQLTYSKVYSITDLKCWNRSQYCISRLDRLRGCQIGDGFHGCRLKFGYITDNVLFPFNKFLKESFSR